MISSPCIILCGGKSSRMGEDKAFLKIENQTLIEYQAQKMNKIFQNVYVSAKKPIPNIKNMILDTEVVNSPLHAIKTILSKFENTHVFILAVDVPNISQANIDLLYQNIKNHDIVSPKIDNMSEPLCSFYSTSIIDTVNTNIKNKDYKLKSLLAKVNTKYISFKDKKEFININTKEDYENL